MKLLRNRYMLIVYGICALLMLVGTFLDFNISSLIANTESQFGRFFLLFGQFPVMLCGFSASALLLRSIPEEKNEKLIFTALAACGFVGGMIGVKEIIENATGFAMIIFILIELLIACGLFLFVYMTCDTRNPAKLRRTALFILFTVLITTAVVVFIKIPWGRPRYRSIIAVSNLEYQPWYQIGKSARDAFEGVLDHDEFKSFPSGHTASAAYILTLIALKNVIPVLKDQERLLMIIGFAWVILTAVARIVAGAHFLTDVTFGFMISFTIMILLGKYLKIDRRKKKTS